MSIAIPSDTAEVLGSTAAKCESRALFASCFADPTAKEDTRKAWFQSLIDKKAVPHSHWHPPAARLIHARLMSRLMVNMAGGVMENAGLHLDRYGLPLIPGSAIKGCARRAALAALREWCETGTKPEGDDNLFTTLCTPFPTPAALLATIARTFGWVDTDWSDDLADFRWAADEKWLELRAQTRELLGSPIAKETAGSIAFLDAHPNRDPGIVLDVVTPHHTKYYESKDPHAVATDTEEPVPVYFPAVREQGENDHFTFPLVPLRRADAALLNFAQTALRTGLEVFGIGAKTNAGYGWFDASVELNQRIAERQAEEIKRLEEQACKAAEKARQEAEANARAETKAALAAALEGLTPEQQGDKKLELLNEAQFEAKVRSFCKEPKKGGPTEPEKQAIVRALRGPHLAYWQTFKAKATKGDLATVDQAIRQLSKTLNLGKMP